MSSAGPSATDSVSESVMQGILLVESPREAAERYGFAYPSSPFTLSNGPTPKKNVAASGAEDESPPLESHIMQEASGCSGLTTYERNGLQFDRPHTIARLLGYSWDDGYSEESSEHRQDRWLAHKSFGPVVVSEGGTSRETTMTATPLVHSAATRGGRRFELSAYEEQYYRDNVWAQRNTAASTPVEIVARDGLHSAGSWSASSTSEVVAVSVNPAMARRPGRIVPAAVPALRGTGKSAEEPSADVPTTLREAQGDAQPAVGLRVTSTLQPALSQAWPGLAHTRSNASPGPRVPASTGPAPAVRLPVVHASLPTTTPVSPVVPPLSNRPAPSLTAGGRGPVRAGGAGPAARANAASVSVLPAVRQSAVATQEHRRTASCAVEHPLHTGTGEASPLATQERPSTAHPPRMEFSARGRPLRAMYDDE